jgi:hypothetical protein
MPRPPSRSTRANDRRARPPQRHRSDHDTCCETEDRGKGNRREIHRDLVEPRQLGRPELHERLDTDCRKEPPEHAPRCCQQQALGEEGDGNARAAPAKGRAHRHFAPARLRSNQKEVGDVRTGDQ